MRLLRVSCCVHSFSCGLNNHIVHRLQLRVFYFFLYNIREYVCGQYLDLKGLNFYQIVRIYARMFLGRRLLKLLYLIKKKAENLFYFVIQNYFNLFLNFIDSLLKPIMVWGWEQIIVSLMTRSYFFKIYSIILGFKDQEIL